MSIIMKVKIKEIMQPVLSIVIPIYNVEPYVKSCIESILNNKLDDKIEVIIVDDGSKDNSISIVKKLIKGNKHFTIYKKNNGGLSSARNYGIQHAHGKWIWFVDSDDCISKYSISYLINNITKFNNSDVFIFRYKTFSNDSEIEDTIPLQTVKKLNLSQAMNTLLNMEYASFAWNKIFKKKLFEDLEFPVGRNYEDMSIMYKVYEKANNITLLSGILYYYRQRQTSISHDNSVKNLRDAAVANYEMYKFMKLNFPDLSTKLEHDTVITIISYFHRLSKKSIDSHNELVHFIKYDVKVNNYNVRYKIELQAIRHSYLMFKVIGKIGAVKRKLEK